MLGACRSACRVDADCRRDAVGAGSVCLRRASARFGVCAEPCARKGAAACPAELSCSPLQPGAVRDNFCLHVSDPCPSTDDGVCDEAGRGTGLCVAGSDEKDCCTLPRAGGGCDLLTQCGRAAELACQAVGINVDLVETDCRAFAARPIGSRCETSSQCGKGANCVSSICKALCSNDERGHCAVGQCLALRFSGRAATNAGSCSLPCDFENGKPCMQGTVCAQTGNGSACHVQPATCPQDRYGDHVCDETTRVCAPGTDADGDCGR